MIVDTFQFFNELDVLEMEGTLKELALEEVQEDLRIRALLEVAALQHRS